MLSGISCNTPLPLRKLLCTPFRASQLVLVYECSKQLLVNAIGKIAGLWGALAQEFTLDDQ